MRDSGLRNYGRRFRALGHSSTRSAYVAGHSWHCYSKDPIGTAIFGSLQNSMAPYKRDPYQQHNKVQQQSCDTQHEDANKCYFAKTKGRAGDTGTGRQHGSRTDAKLSMMLSYDGQNGVL